MIIDLDAIKETSYIGIRRAAIFAGFGINCADNDLIKEFSLKKYSLYSFLPEEISDELATSYKLEYRNWITYNALRELFDSFEVYLNQLFNVANLIKRSTLKIKIYTHSGINKKIEYLRELYGITCSFPSSLTGMNNVRNCLYHRRGLIAHDDLDAGKNVLTVEWFGIDINIFDLLGNKKTIDYPILEGTIVNEKETITVTVGKRKKEFNINSVINFTIPELLEICYYFNYTTDDLYQSMISFFKANNVSINKDIQSK